MYGICHEGTFSLPKIQERQHNERNNSNCVFIKENTNDDRYF